MKLLIFIIAIVWAVSTLLYLIFKRDDKWPGR